MKHVYFKIFFLLVINCSFSQDKPVVISLKQDVFVSDEFKWDCNFTETFLLNKDENIIIYDAKKCVETSKRYYEFLYNSKSYFIDIEKLDNNITFHDSLRFLENEKLKLLKIEAIKFDSIIQNINIEIVKEYLVKSNKPIYIFDWGLYSDSFLPDSKNIEISFLNTSKKKIKYIYVTFEPKNPVDDIVVFNGRKNKTLKCVGPINPNDFGNYKFDNVWYSSVIDRVSITSLKVEYFDNTTKLLKPVDNYFFPEKFKSFLK